MKQSTMLMGGLVMSFMLLSGVINAGLIGPNRSSIEAAFDLSHARFGAALAGVQIVCSVVLLLLAASRSKPISNPVKLGLGLFAQASGLIIISQSQSAAMVAAGWGLTIIGTIFAAVSNNLSARLWPQSPGRGVHLLHAFSSVGKLLGPILAAMCLSLGWRLSFLFVGILSLSLLVVFGLSHRALARFEVQTSTDQVAQHTGSKFLVLRQPLYWMSVLPFGLISGADVSFASLVPLFFEKSYGFTPAIASLLLSVHLLGMVAGRFTFFLLSEKLNSNVVIGLCLVGGIFAFPAMMMPHLPIQMASLFLLGWMFSGTWPAFYAQVSQLHQSNRQMLDMGTALANAVGIAACIWLSSLVAQHNLTLAMFTGPVAIWIFGVYYFASRLSKPVGNADGVAEPASIPTARFRARAGNEV